MKRLFLLDAYALIYRAYYAFIKNPRINSKGLNTSAIYGFVTTLEEVLNKEQPTHIAVAFDPQGPTFRHEMFEQYKAQREETPEAIRTAVPIIKDIIRAYNIPILEVCGYEADDVIGTTAKLAEKRGFDTYMMTPDKDFGQLVSDHIFQYKPRHGGGFDIYGVEEVKERYGISSPLMIIDMLGLMGDSADNIPGCPGVGEKTAIKLINEFGSIENLLSSTDKLKGALKTKIEENVEKIKFSKFLATIKIDVPIEFDEEGLKYEKPNCDKLEKIFAELEFRNLAEKILGKIPAAKPEKKKEIKKVVSQPSLFDLFAGEEAEEKEYANVESSNNRPHTYYLIDTEEKIKDLASKLECAEKFAFDTETTSIEPINAKLVGMSFSLKEDEAFYVPVPEDDNETQKIVGRFKTALENEKSQKIGQNIKYDFIVMQNYGVELKGDLFDTMVAHYLLQPDGHHNMDYLAEVYLGHKTISIDTLIGPKGKNQRSMREVPLADICEYAAEDADITLRLKNLFETKLKEEGLEKLFYEIEMPLVKVLAQMEAEGVKIDTKALGESSKIMTRKACEIETRIFELAGETFNVNSPRQVGEILFMKLKIDPKAKPSKQGGYSTSEEVLTKLINRHPIVPLILEYRGLKKLLSTYINALPELINSRTGKIHTSFNQTVTATGRLSSSNPNLQNIPIRDDNGKEIRRAFIPNNGEVFFSADYSQIELRIMAHLSKDENMVNAFLSGEDIHAATAAKIFNVPLNEVTSDMRRKAKTANFGIIYGISAFGLAERLNISRTEAKGLIDGYFESFPSVKEYMEKSIEVAREKGYVETITGRRRVLPDINSNNSIVRGYAERNAINAPIQGSAADIIKIAMVRVANRIKSENLSAKMIIQVHDELNFSVPENELELLKRVVTEEMSAAYQMTVPLIADTGSGKNWLEAH
ncbi:MAG: DNA polymerase I [Muribaculaceae bacterium]|nr:DNA polymerase I [Muribaculaceae bacterium]